MNRFDVEFLSILAGDVEGKGWGAWMTASGEYLVNKGYAKCCYEITERGCDYLRTLEDWNGGAKVWVD